MTQQPTHVTVQSNKKPITPVEAFKVALFTDSMKSVESYYNGNTDEARRFLTSAVEYVRKVPKLLQCDRLSLTMAFVQSAQFRFMPSGISGESYVIPYGNEAKFQLGYQGIVTLLYRTNKIVGITSNIIYQNDVFEYEEGLNAKLIHKPAMFGKDKGEAIGAYTVAQMTGGEKTFKVMDKAAILGIKELSKAKNVKDSPWNSDKDPEMWMWKKTCLIQHAKLLPKTQELQMAIEKDYDGEGLEKPKYDAGGPAVGKTFHSPEETIPTDEVQTEDPTKLCSKGKHLITKVKDGVCSGCESDALEEAENGRGR